MPASQAGLVERVSYIALAASLMAVSPNASGNEVHERKTSNGRTIVFSGNVSDRNQHSHLHIANREQNERSDTAFEDIGKSIEIPPIDGNGIRFSSIGHSPSIEEGKQILSEHSARSNIRSPSALETILRAFSGGKREVPKLAFHPSIDTQIRLQQEELKRKNPLYAKEEPSPYKWSDGLLINRTMSNATPSNAAHMNQFPSSAFAHTGSVFLDRIRIGNCWAGSWIGKSDHGAGSKVTNQDHRGYRLNCEINGTVSFYYDHIPRNSWNERWDMVVAKTRFPFVSLEKGKAWETTISGLLEFPLLQRYGLPNDRSLILPPWWSPSLELNIGGKDNNYFRIQGGLIPIPGDENKNIKYVKWDVRYEQKFDAFFNFVK